MKKRYCEMCDLVVPKKQTECKLCGAPTIAMTAEETADMMAWHGQKKVSRAVAAAWDDAVRKHPERFRGGPFEMEKPS